MLSELSELSSAIAIFFSDRTRSGDFLRLRLRHSRNIKAKARIMSTSGTRMTAASSAVDSPFELRVFETSVAAAG